MSTGRRRTAARPAGGVAPADRLRAAVARAEGGIGYQLGHPVPPPVWGQVCPDPQTAIADQLAQVLDRGAARCGRPYGWLRSIEIHVWPLLAPADFLGFPAASVRPDYFPFADNEGGNPLTCTND